MITLKICIVIPAHNEEKRIAKTFDNLKKSVLKEYGKDLIILVVSDASTDRTNQIVKSYGRRYSQIKLIVGKERAGKGGVLLKGFKEACSRYKPDIVGFVDADPSVPGSEVVKMLHFLQSNKVDGVIASRYQKDSKIIGNIGVKRFIASRGYNAMVRFLFGLDFKDTQCGAKFFKAKHLSKVLDDICLTDMTIDLNILYELHRRNSKIAEVGVVYNVVNEHSNVRLKRELPRQLIVSVCYRITRSPLNKIIPKRLKGAIYDKVKRW